MFIYMFNIHFMDTLIKFMGNTKALLDHIPKDIISLKVVIAQELGSNFRKIYIQHSQGHFQVQPT